MRGNKTPIFLVLSLFVLLANGCFWNIDNPPTTPEVPTVSFSSIVWSTDGSKFYVACDTSMIGHGDWLYIYGRDGTELGRYLIPDSAFAGPLSVLDNDSSVLVQNHRQAGQFFYLKDTTIPLPIGWLSTEILAESPNHSMLLCCESGGGQYRQLDLLTINDAGIEIRKTWFENTPRFDVQTPQWLNPATFGYFVGDPDRSQTTFMILDTNLNRVDSVAVGRNQLGNTPDQFRYGPRAFYFETGQGLSKIDSVTHTSTVLLPFQSSIVDVAPNGAFLIATITQSPNTPEYDTRIVNTITGATIQANNLRTATISPQSDRVATIVVTGLVFATAVYPISAP